MTACVTPTLSTKSMQGQANVAQSYAEFLFGNNYVLTNGVPFYVGLYTGTGNFHPPDGIYADPLFGWAKLVNNQGVIQLLGGAIEYGGAGIYAGTQNIIQSVPEPGSFSLAALGAALFGFRHSRKGR